MFEQELEFEITNNSAQLGDPGDEKSMQSQNSMKLTTKFIVNKQNKFTAFI